MRENLKIFIAILSGWLLFFYATGLLTAGLHLDLDPYAFMGLDLYYQNGKNFTEDLNQILNSIFFNKSGFGLWGHIMFAFFAKFFGGNMVGIRTFFAILGATSFFMLYLTAIKIGWTKRIAWLFPSVLLFGAQFWIWYNMCGEPIGIFFSSLTFLSASLAVKRNSLKWLIINILSIIATSLSKESFILLLPSFIIFYLWRLCVVHPSWTWRRLIVKALPVIFPTLLIFFLEIAYIILVLGANARGVGISIHTPLSLYVRVFLDFFATNTLYIYLFSGVFLMLTFIGYDKIIVSLKSKEFLLFTLLLVSIIAPQIILHAQSGWVTRYLFPALFSVAFILAFILDKLKTYVKVYNLYTLLLILYIGAEMMPKISDNPSQAFRQLRNYVTTCQATDQLIESVVSKSPRDGITLIISNPADQYVWPATLSSLLRTLYKKENIARLSLSFPYEYDAITQGRIDALQSHNQAFEKMNKSEIQDIVIMPFIEKLFIHEHGGWFNPDDYERQAFWRFVHYRKKNI